MSFVEEEDVIEVDGGRDDRGLRRRRASTAPPPPWPRMTYDEAMLRYGSDKPDTRFGLEIADVGDAAARHRSSRSSRACSAAAAWSARSTPARARCRARSSTGSTRSSSATAPRRSRRSSPADGGWARQPREVLHAPSRSRRSTPALGASDGDLLLFVADARADVAAASLGALRLELGRALRPDPRRPPRRCCGSSTSRCSSATPSRAALDGDPPPVHRADRARLRRPRRAALARLRPRARRRRDRRRLDPYPRRRGPAAGLRGARAWPRRRRSARFGFLLDALQLRRAAARRHRARHRPHRGDPRRAATRSAT